MTTLSSNDLANYKLKDKISTPEQICSFVNYEINNIIDEETVKIGLSSIADTSLRQVVVGGFDGESFKDKSHNENHLNGNQETSAKKKGDIAIGSGSFVRGGTAVGYKTQIGTEQEDSYDSIAIGSRAFAKKGASIAIGSSNSSYIGGRVVTGSSHAIAIGRDTAAGFKHPLHAERTGEIFSDFISSLNESKFLGYSYVIKDINGGILTANGGNLSVNCNDVVYYCDEESKWILDQDKGIGSIAIGGDVINSEYKKTQAAGQESIAIGCGAVTNADNAIQLGAGTNINPNTLQFRDVQIIDEYGDINYNIIEPYFKVAENLEMFERNQWYEYGYRLSADKDTRMGGIVRVEGQNQYVITKPLMLSDYLGFYYSTSISGDTTEYIIYDDNDNCIKSGWVDPSGEVWNIKGDVIMIESLSSEYPNAKYIRFCGIEIECPLEVGYFYDITDYTHQIVTNSKNISYLKQNVSQNMMVSSQYSINPEKITIQDKLCNFDPLVLGKNAISKSKKTVALGGFDYESESKYSKDNPNFNFLDGLRPTETNNDGDIAIGDGVYVNGGYAFGYKAQVGNKKQANKAGLAIGLKSYAKGESSIAIAGGATSNFIGSRTTTGSFGSIAIGRNATAGFANKINVDWTPTSKKFSYTIDELNSIPLSDRIGSYTISSYNGGILTAENAAYNLSVDCNDVVYYNQSSKKWMNDYSMAAGAIAIGSSIGVGNEHAEAAGACAIAIGSRSFSNGTDAIALGGANAIGYRSVAIGRDAKVVAENAVQIGEGENDEANTLKFRNSKLIDKFGNIPYQTLSSSIYEDTHVLNFTGLSNEMYIPGYRINGNNGNIDVLQGQTVTQPLYLSDYIAFDYTAAVQWSSTTYGVYSQTGAFLGRGEYKNSIDVIKVTNKTLTVDDILKRFTSAHYIRFGSIDAQQQLSVNVCKKEDVKSVVDAVKENQLSITNINTEIGSLNNKLSNLSLSIDTCTISGLYDLVGQIIEKFGGTYVKANQG